MNEYDNNSRRFLMRWIGASLLVWPVAIVGAGMALLPLVFILGRMFRTINDPMSGNGTDFLFFISMAIAGAAIGFVIGSFQRYLLRKYLLWTADRWRMASAIGGGIGLLLIAVMGEYSQISDERPFLAIMAIFATSLGLVQYFTLRTATRHAWLWILTNVSAGLVFGNIVHTSLPYPFSAQPLWTLMLCVGAAAAQGFITGLIIHYLFERQSYPMTDHAGSIWDRAI